MDSSRCIEDKSGYPTDMVEIRSALDQIFSLRLNWQFGGLILKKFQRENTSLGQNHPSALATPVSPP
jgi:hypothetical protein